MSIVCDVLHKEHLGAAQAGLPKRRRVRLLLCRQTWQHAAREARHDLEFLRRLFQGKQEVVDYLNKCGGRKEGTLEYFHLDI